MVGRLRKLLCRYDVQLLLVVEKPLRVELSNLCRSLALGSCGSDDLISALLKHFLTHMADISDVLDMNDIQSVQFKRPANPVGHQIRPEIPYMGVSVHSRTTCVHLDNPGLYWAYLVNLLGQSVV